MEWLTLEVESSIPGERFCFFVFFLFFFFFVLLWLLFVFGSCIIICYDC